MADTNATTSTQVSPKKFWLAFFIQAGIAEKYAQTYADCFVENHMRRSMLDDLTIQILRDIGVKPIGDCLCILKCVKALKQEQVHKSPESPPSAEVSTFEPSIEVTSTTIPVVNKTPISTTGDNNAKITKPIATRLGETSTEQKSALAKNATTATMTSIKNQHYKDLKITIDMVPSDSSKTPSIAAGKNLNERLSKRKSQDSVNASDVQIVADVKRNKTDTVAAKQNDTKHELVTNPNSQYKYSIQDRLGWKK